jgi:hypothetical protein
MKRPATKARAKAKAKAKTEPMLPVPGSGRTPPKFRNKEDRKAHEERESAAVDYQKEADREAADKERKKFAKGGAVCRGGGAATRGKKFIGVR